MKKIYRILCSTVGLSMIASTSFAHSFSTNDLDDQSSYILTNIPVPLGSATLKAYLMINNENKACNYKIDFSLPEGADGLTPYEISVKKEPNSPAQCKTLTVKSIANSNATTITYPQSNLPPNTIMFDTNDNTGWAEITYKNTQNDREITLHQLSQDIFELQSKQTKDINQIKCTYQGTHDISPREVACGRDSWAGFDNVITSPSLPPKNMYVEYQDGKSDIIGCNYQTIDNTTDYKVKGDNSGMCPQEIKQGSNDTYNITYNISAYPRYQLSKIYPTGDRSSDSPVGAFFYPFFLENGAPSLPNLKATITFNKPDNSVYISGKNIYSAFCKDQRGINEYLVCGGDWIGFENILTGRKIPTDNSKLYVTYESPNSQSDDDVYCAYSYNDNQYTILPNSGASCPESYTLSHDTINIKPLTDHFISEIHLTFPKTTNTKETIMVTINPPDAAAMHKQKTIQFITYNQNNAIKISSQDILLGECFGTNTPGPTPKGSGWLICNK